MNSIKVVIAEDQNLVLEALAALISLEEDFEIVGTAVDGSTALEVVRKTSPDLLVTDIEMPSLGGLELTATVTQELATRVVIVTLFARPGYLRRAMDAGAKGYILKDSPPDKLISTLRAVHQGRVAIAPELAAKAWEQIDLLTKRERQVLILAEQGLPSKLIAARLHISPGTVRNHISEAIVKLGVTNRIEATKFAREQGLL